MLTLILLAIYIYIYFGQNNIPKVWPEKYDFDLYKGFFMDKIIQTCQILKGIFFFKSLDFMISSSM
jgi:hypothetical protein